MKRSGSVYLYGVFCGVISETEDGYFFSYDKGYLARLDAKEISLTFPLREVVYKSKTLFSFFDGLIPEGWLLDIAEKNWKVNYRDRMGLLLTCCKDCIGAVSVISNEEF